MAQNQEMLRKLLSLLTLSALLAFGQDASPPRDVRPVATAPTVGAACTTTQALQRDISAGATSGHVFTCSAGIWVDLGNSATGQFTNTGTFTNTVMSYALRGLVNSCDPLTHWQAGQSVSNYAVSGVAGCVDIAVGSTVYGALGLFGSVNNSSTTTNAVGGYFSAFAGAAGSGSATASRVRLWAFNTLQHDKGFSNVLMTNEFDFVVNGTGTKVLGLQLTGLGSGSMSSDSAGITIGPVGSVQWPNGVYITDGAAATAAYVAGATSTGNNVSSQPIRMISRTAGAVNNTVDITAGPGGGINFTLSAGAGFAFVNTAGNVVVIAGGGGITQLGLALSALAPTTNGTIIYCTDCLANSVPCTASSTGAFAKRLAGAWRCD